MLELLAKMNVQNFSGLQWLSSTNAFVTVSAQKLISSRMKKFERLGGPLDETVLFSLHKCHVVIWRRGIISFEILYPIAMQGYFIT